MSDHAHPDEVDLDRFRAGLLDDEPARRAAVGDHLASCETCRARLGQWERLVARLDEHATADGAPPRPAFAARATPGRWWLPAVAATVAAAVGLVIMWEVARGPAGNEAGASLSAAESRKPAAGADNSESVPDLYAEIDFYLWMLRHDNGDDGDSSS